MKYEREAAGIDEQILKTYDEIEHEKEEKFVNLMIEIIVSITLKECYEEGDQIFKVQPAWAKQWLY